MCVSVHLCNVSLSAEYIVYALSSMSLRLHIFQNSNIKSRVFFFCWSGLGCIPTWKILRMKMRKIENVLTFVSTYMCMCVFDVRIFISFFTEKTQHTNQYEFSVHIAQTFCILPNVSCAQLIQYIWKKKSGLFSFFLCSLFFGIQFCFIIYPILNKIYIQFMWKKKIL